MTVAAPEGLGAARASSDEGFTLYSLCVVGVPVSMLTIYTLASSSLVAPPIGGPEGVLEASLRVVPLLIGLPLVMRDGLRNARLSFAFAAWIAAWSISLLVGAHPESWNLQGAIAMLATYAGPWALTAAILSPGDARRIVATVAVLPAALLMVTLPLWLAGVVQLMELDETTGRERLGGLLIPAAWASLSLVSVLASALMIATNRRAGWLWLSIGFGVLLLSEGRGATLTLVIASMPLVWRLLVRRPGEPRERYLGRVAAVFAVALIVLVAARAVFENRGDVIPVPIYLSETVEQSDPTSGRLRAWSYYLAAVRQKPIVGYGASAVFLLSAQAQDPLIRDNFKAAHNEYIQVLVEFGVVGLLIVMIGIVAEVAYLRRHSHPAVRLFPLVLALAFGASAATDNATGPMLALPLCLLLAACATIHPEKLRLPVHGMSRASRGSRISAVRN